MRKGAILPDRCIKCNFPANGYRLERNLAWHPPVWYLTLLISPLLYILVALFVRHKAKIQVGVCEQHRVQRSRAIAFSWVAILGGLVLIVGGASWIDSDWVAIPVVVGLIMIVSGIFRGLIKAQFVTTKSIDEHHVWLSKVDPEYLNMLPVWLD